MSKFNSYLQDELGQFGWFVVPSKQPFNHGSTTFQWMKTPLVKEEAFEILTEEQLFNNVKKELKEVSVKLN
jgi:hypothetical protein